MAEADDDGKLTRAYGFNPDTQDGALDLWSTEPVWQADLNGKSTLSEANFHYLATDHLGTPILATDKQGNKTRRSYSEAFGNTGVENGSSAEINLRFPGQYWDKETGLHQNYFRDYSPARGRYVQSDPTGLWGGLNTYGYAYNDPLGYIDPTGEVPIAPIVVGYLRCVASCTGQAAAMEGLFGDLKCFDPGQTAKDCALSCANPLNWFGKFRAKGGNSKPPITRPEPPKTSPNKPAFQKGGPPRDPKTGNYLPHPNAEGPHTTLGTRSGRNGEYTQGATFDHNGNFKGRTDVTNHGRGDHTNPHWHPATSPNGVGPAQPVSGR